MTRRKEVGIRCAGAKITDGTSQVTITISSLSHDEAIAVVNALQGVVPRTVAAAMKQVPGVENAVVLPDHNTGTIQ